MSAPGGIGVEGGFVEQVANPATFTVDGTLLNGSLSLSWAAQAGALFYRIYVGLAPERLSLLVDDVVSTSYSFNGLNPAQRYFAQVSAVYGANQSVASPVTEVVPGNPVAAPAAGVTTDGGLMTLSWAAVPKAAWYDVNLGTASGGESLYQDGLAGLSLTVPNLNSGGAYYFTVTAFDALGNSATSSEVSIAAAANPTFSPAGGVYPQTQTVALASATAGASIYYTVDGSTPTPSSMPYTAPLTVAFNTTLKALAVKAGALNSQVSSAGYTIVQGQMSGLSWMMPCYPSGGVPGQYCQCAPSPDYTFTNNTSLQGVAGTSYSVTLRIRGVFETKAYSGGSSDGEYWQVGGSPVSSPQNVYQLTISDPPQTYFINNGWSGAPVQNNTVYIVDYQKTITINAGAAITMSANTGTDQYESENVGNNLFPAGLSVSDNDPAHPIAVVQPYNGQFAQLDALSVVLL